ncbi:plasminogen-binding N-terminal domain-containing protein [Sulfurovum sp. zt1-1]|uniref:Plasminogen-binding N-terminal domain-containing protein n=1 Tax=Sulfurovum zhangzhouensis TaxID=3019067 RepID=A0ABT7QYN2_9BACT|nr:plasminogen-binding N-terminal domain-containing protein [Sulfurovum zhangzhouensis]MDM5271416.1 plasminogen-binding N-terminal domain-containing protein [Sulfurovum zhangzhouensis]
MRKFALITLFSIPLFSGFFPSTVQTSVADADQKQLKLKQALPLNGMSGVVIHNYGKSAQAITSYVIQTNQDGSAKSIKHSVIDHEQLPTIKTPITRGDKVIGGYMYQNVLLLAPDAETYAKITKQYNKNWIHPDLYALFLSVEGDKVPSRENLSEFAKAYQVGLVFIVRNGTAVLLDPVSKKIINEQKLDNLPKTGKFPFFSRFEKIESGWFDFNEDENDYYKTMEQL